MLLGDIFNGSTDLYHFFTHLTNADNCWNRLLRYKRLLAGSLQASSSRRRREDEFDTDMRRQIPDRGDAVGFNPKAGSL